jgi:phosphate:Na+ symporter
MVVGFVNAGLMNLSQAVGIIMGANVGTTITGWLVSAVEWASFLKPENLAPIAVLIGAGLVLFAKRNNIKQVGEVIVGFGMLFIGISMMTSGVSPLRESVAFRNMFSEFGRNPVLGLIVGAVVTAIIQSSSASVGILQSLTLTGLVSWDAAVYIIMGQNIGTCVTAMLSGLGASRNAKGAAYIHLMFNVFGSIFFSIIAVIVFKFINPALGMQEITMTQISLVHTAFNVANTVLMYPFANGLVKMAERLTASKKNVSEDDETEPVHLDDRILSTPSIAIANCIKEIVRLGNMSYKNLNLACDTLLTKDTKDIEKILEREKNIDNLTKAITQYMVKLCNSNLTDSENTTVTGLFHTVNDMERIGDHCENLAETTEYLIADSLEFSDKAKESLQKMFTETQKSVRNAIIALTDNDIDFAEKVIKEEERVDNLEKSLREEHIGRLAENVCNPLVGVAYLDVLTNLERVSDHALNVAQSVISNNTR